MRIGWLIAVVGAGLFFQTGCAGLDNSNGTDGNDSTVSGSTGTTLALTVSSPSADRSVPQGTVVTIELVASNLTGQGATLTLLVENRTDLAQTTLASDVPISGIGAPTRFTWDTEGFATGQYNITARLVSGNQTREVRAVGRITVDVPPQFLFTAPVADTTLPADGTVAIKWTAGDPNGNGKVRIGLDLDDDHSSSNEIYLTAERALPTETEADSLDWDGKDVDGNDVAVGTYRLFALLDDGLNGVSTVDAPARLTVPEKSEDQDATFGIRKPAGDDEFLNGAPPLNIEFGLNDSSDLLIDLKLDTDDNHANGNEITILSQRFERAGTATDTFSWNGTDSAGGNVPDGIYRILLIASNGADTPRTAASTGLVFRRVSTAGALSRQTWQRNRNVWALAASENSPTARRLHALAYDSVRAVTVLFGGVGNSGANDETWEWNRTDWRRLDPAAKPPALSSHAMAYDSAREVSVLFGGLNGASASDQTWEWDGEIWVQRPEAGPAARFGHAMAYDNDRGVVVLFGGSDGSALNNETWEWDGGAWVRAVPANSPSPRQGHAMCYDADRQVIVLFGGGDFAGTLNNETWEWDGNDWTQAVSGTSPPAARRNHGLVYDRNRSVTILFGGTDGTIPNSQTWQWTGANWNQVTPDLSPAARDSQAMAFDSGANQTVLFGGNSGIPLVALLEPAAAKTVDAGQFVTIKWRDDDPTGAATVRLVIDDDRNPNETTETGAAEIEILASRGAKDDGLQDSFSWQVPSTIPPGTYFVFAYIDHDGAAPADHVSIAPATITIRDPAEPQTP